MSMLSKIKNKICNKIKSKNGNSILFMPYLVVFGTLLMYITMEMGIAYVRQVQLQTSTDAAARAGIYGGMTGKGAYFYRELAHIYIDLDDSTALGVSRAVFKANISHINGLVDSTGTPKNGDLYIVDVNYSDPTKTKEILDKKKVPVWNRGAGAAGINNRRAINGDVGQAYTTFNDIGNSSTKQFGKYELMPIKEFETQAQVMNTGNFFVAVEGEYHTLVAFRTIDKNTMRVTGFASALATARLKTTP